MKKVPLIICLMLALLSSGCATIMNGSSTQDIFVTSKPPGAIVTTTTKWIKAPGIFTLPRTKSTTLIARLPGYEEMEQEIKSGLSPWIFGNGIGGLCFGTVFNFMPVAILTIVDFSIGSTGELSPTEVHFELVPKKYTHQHN